MHNLESIDGFLLLYDDVITDGTSNVFLFGADIKYNGAYPVIIKKIELSKNLGTLNIAGDLSLTIHRNYDPGVYDQGFSELNPSFFKKNSGTSQFSKALHIGSSLAYTGVQELSVFVSFRPGDILNTVGSVNFNLVPPASKHLYIYVGLFYEIVNPFKQ